MEKIKISRRQFAGVVGGIVGGVVGAGSGLFTSCNTEKGGKYKLLPSDIPVIIPEMGDKAIAGKPVRAGMIGCGNRGSGAAFNFLDAADGVTIVAMADLFEDRLETLRGRLREQKNITVPDSKIFYGFDAYKKVCEDPDVDMVIVANARRCEQCD